MENSQDPFNQKPMTRRVRKKRRRTHTLTQNEPVSTQIVNAISDDDMYYLNDAGQVVHRIRKKRKKTSNNHSQTSNVMAPPKKHPYLPLLVLLALITGMMTILINCYQPIAIPDFTTKSIQVAKKWSEKYDIPITTQDVFIPNQKNGQVLKQTVDSVNQSLTLLVSTQKPEKADLVDLPDFKGKSRADVQSWAKLHRINVTMTNVESTAPVDTVINQSILPETLVNLNTVLHVTISKKRPQLTVPDYSQKSLSELKADSSRLKEVTIQERFSETIPYGKLISQLPKKGEVIDLDEYPNPLINLVYSIGRPYLPAYFGQMEQDIPCLIERDFTSKGAKVTFQTYDVPSSYSKGSIVEMNKFNQYIPLDFHVKFGISTGYTDYTADPSFYCEYNEK
ncbi:hypothetical protein CBF34_05925 [Vagococcus penaei]|uniref:Uncharacterized protein n=1 Tax=Vagococcus penaei TaxID=633807 RepID=A0A1Q2D3I5_9ENTE|nr:PASTA domain-containing protein [Vagococcus penaei]AQP52934.1 hypothetical protein BW732_00965 [Vagococcus penaei]RSU02609.1 hypothetical protein CBF34_05925 [Vagococcus penaei]